MNTSDMDVFVTAEEAWPEFERMVLNAERRIVAGFRIFDLRTKLCSDEGRAIGDDWFDLLAHTLRRGVELRFVISDFDPIFATELHEQAWSTKRQVVALREAVDVPDAQFDINVALHPAKAGGLPWLGFLPAVLKRQNESLEALSVVQKERQAVGLDNETLPDLHTVSHHQKVAVADGDVLYIGGLDLNRRRYDTTEHDRAATRTWSDVQLMIRGPEAAEGEQHLDEFLGVIARDESPSPMRYLRRTLSRPRLFQAPYVSPGNVLCEIEAAHLESFVRAQHLVYIETQFFRSSRIAAALAKAAGRRDTLDAIIVLPALPEDVAFEEDVGLSARYGMALQYDALAEVREAFGQRLTLATPVQPRFASSEERDTLAGSPVIHVHNKVLIEDDTFALVGSANLNGRSMQWDTELALELTAKDRVKSLRTRLFEHWFDADLPPAAETPETQQKWWDKVITANGVCLPENRRGFLVPHDPENRKDLIKRLPGVTENIV